MSRRLALVVAIGAVVTILLTTLSSRTSVETAGTLLPLVVAAAGVLATVIASVSVVALARSRRTVAEVSEKMTDRLAEREHRLEQSNRELERFATIAAHDLQEPLRTILTFTDLIERRYGQTLNTEARDYLLRVAGAAARMRALIEDLLTYARIGQAERRFEPVDLRQSLNEAVANLEPLILETGATIHAGELPVVMGNQQGLTQLFTNLLSNAMKYRLADAPRVEITAERQGKEWVIAVADNGKGIDPAYHERIFELFRRLEPRGGASGTGLGLAICARVVDVHSGRIWVRSAVGKGATFFFTLPAREPNAE
ncbi:MAG: ATP-binding protein [Acidimicrobiales bacterium]|nr:ATP-binding protein [Acidimicrobiales bacterium]